MVKRLAVAVAAICLVSAGQEQQQGEYSVSGTVVNQVTGEPVKFATVSLLGPGMVSTQTDAQGVFRFTGLAAGARNVNVIAMKPGFSGSGGVVVKAGSSRDSVVIRLTPNAVVTGKVVDEDGEAIPGVRVEVLRSTVVQGVRKEESAGSESTDDRGFYRIPVTNRGVFLIRANGTASVQGMRIYRGFAPAYFGGGDSSTSAARVVIEPGTEFRADFSLRSFPVRRITGRISNPVPGGHYQVELLRGGVNVSAAAWADTRSGRITVQDAIDGVYLLQITSFSRQQTWQGVQEVRVAGRDVTGIVIALQPGETVNGSVRWEGPVPESGQTRRIMVWMDQLGDTRFPVASRPLDPRTDTSFRLEGVTPGRYRLRVEGLNNGYVDRVHFGDQDALENPEITIGPAPPPVEVVMRTDSGAIRGRLAGIDPATVGQVLLLPETSGRAPHESSCMPDGTFTFLGIAPGAYRVLAWKKDVDVEWSRPGVRDALAGRGQRVEVAAGQTVNAEVTALQEAVQ